MEPADFETRSYTDEKFLLPVFVSFISDTSYTSCFSGGLQQLPVTQSTSSLIDNSFSVDATVMAPNKCPILCEQVFFIFSLQVSITTLYVDNNTQTFSYRRS